MSVNSDTDFLRQPEEIIDGIKVFSKVNEYIDIYQRISSEHIESIKKSNANPFIREDAWVEMEQSTRKLIDEFLEPGMKVLDVGVGLGRLWEVYKGIQLYGIDISLPYLKIAREKGVEVAFSLIEDMPYLDNTFDIITACDVLEHVIDLHTCILQIIRVLKPGGRLIIRVPLNESLEGYIGENTPYEYVHLRKFDLASLRILFERVYKLKYVKSAEASKKFMVPENLSQKFFSQDTISRLMKRDLSFKSPLMPLRQAVQISQEEYLDFILNLRDNNNDLFSDIQNELVNNLEINTVFLKYK